ncbi:PEP-CTERM sorting domain-containing protein [Alteromonas sp. 14N.309.X.WAT.G.H12]|uniref:PEP-CTERM sorting domain-containing protein n=1 Tax=Alteromonas sp. 14N.309.X.WAT.G.H12 TaxID=3120824 RepID=UPI002FD5606A
MKNALTFLTLLLLTTTANATIISVDFEVTSSTGFWGDGSFSGEDLDLDGVLSFDELISFDGSDNIEGETVDLAGLFDFGDFDIDSNTWLSNAFGWSTTENAWFTWNNQINSVNASWATVSTTITSDVAVPAPATMSLLLLSLVAMTRLKRKK